MDTVNDDYAELFGREPEVLFGQEPELLSGREPELELLRGFARRVRSGAGGGLLLVGEYGAGKSTLARMMLPEPGLRVVRCPARPQERAPELVARLLGEPSASASAPAGIGMVAAADAALAAIAEQTRREPVVWVVDDLDLADRSARAFLGYLARRLSHLPAGLVLAGWHPGEPTPADVAVVPLHPLPARETTWIVRGRLGPLAPDWVVDELAAAAGGNPLAAAELAAALSPDETAGRSGLPLPPRPGPGWTGHWRHTAAGLSAASRTAMLVAAAGDGLEIGVLERACTLLGFGPDILRSLEVRGLVLVDDSGHGSAQRPHGSAAYHAAAPEQRAAVHVALAEALTQYSAADGAATRLARLRHRAATASGPDDALGDELEAALRKVPACAAAVDGWIRASELTESDAIRARRLVSAGLASFETGRLAQAAELVKQAGPRADDPAVAGTTALVRGGVALGHGMSADAYRALVEGASAATDREPGLAVDLAARVAGVAWWTGRVDWAELTAELAEKADAADAADAGSPYAAFVRVAVPAGLAMLRSEFSPAVAVLGQALRDTEALTEPRQLLFASEAAGLIGDDLVARRYHERAIREMRQRGRATDAPFALQLGALVLASQGRSEAARASAREGLLLAARAGEEASGPFQHTMLAHIDALDSDTEACAEHQAAVHRGGKRPTASLMWALGRLAVSQARFGEAVEILVPVVLGDDRHPNVSLYATPDLVEAAVAVGRAELALAALDRFSRWRAAGSSWAMAVEPRLLALVAPAAEAGKLFAAACRAPGLAYRPLESARTRLAYGNFLRGQRHRIEAREQLHAALGLFESLQLPAWSETTWSALRAVGETGAAKHEEDQGLTAQELQIARMVIDGRSNREVADVLHLSSRTVEYHLSKVYVKLGLSSRDRLAGALAGRN